MNRLLHLLKTSFVLQNIASWVISMIPSVVESNIQKYGALKKALYLTALEQMEGDYLEFGVFTGSSFVFAMRTQRRLGYLSKHKPRFFGFDSFAGFGQVGAADRHPFYVDQQFAVDQTRVMRNIQAKSKGFEVRIVPGLFETTLAGKSATELGVKRARVVFIDCDLKEPTALALEFVRPVLQPGTMLVMDDFFAYRGASDKGVSGAFSEFCERYPEVRWRRTQSYGYGGVSYIVSEIKPRAAT